ncbi:MAG: glycosyltransferase [Clostridiales bacterium]|nr:glycosyltransferase [Clostridiales bacterium]
MKILLLCNSDLKGGAAIVTYRLMCALCDIGHDATMLVLNKLSDDPRVHLLGTTLGRKARFVAERAYIFAHNGFNRRDLFKVSVANTGYNISRLPLVREADALIVSWINQGMLSLRDIPRDKRVLWVMHDMWCMTGICHHALDCDRYKDTCGNCPYLYDGLRERDLSTKIQARKARVYDSLKLTTWVAVSNWLATCARSSKLLGGRDVQVVHNAFPDHEFYTNPRHEVALPPGVDSTRQLIVMGAARLDDPIKSIPTAIEALNILARKRPDLAQRGLAVFYGDMRDTTLFDNLAFPHVHTGVIHDQAVIRELYASATVTLSTSLFETLPGTLIEGMASGCTVVTTGNGGQRDIVTHRMTGYITGSDPADVADALASALDHPFDRDNQHRAIVEKFGYERIANRIVRACLTRNVNDRAANC